MTHTVEELKEYAEAMRNKSKERLHRLFDIPDGYSNTAIDEIVDNIIGSAILEMAAILREAGVYDATQEETND